MDLIVKKASALTSGELAELGITGIPTEWPIESFPYDGINVPVGFEVMSEEDFALIKANNQAAYDAWVQGFRPIIVPPPAAPLSAGNVPIVEMALRRSDPGFVNFTIVSHDFSDRTTWYQKSIAVTNETLTDSGNGLAFNSAHPHWINMNSPKLTLDYKKVLERDGTLTNASVRYAVIKVDGVTKTEETDYTINYATGTVTFLADQSGKTVTASYYHNDGVANCSEFLYTPPPNTLYRIEHIESQFSRNATFTDTLMAEIWAGSVTGGTTVNLAGYGGFSDTFFNLGYGQSRSMYRNMNDLLNWCNNQYPTIPACGALTNDVLVFPFLYIVHPVISAKQGTLIRLLTKNDIEMGAEICTVTLYMERGPA